jgi:copper(I)-binding protein
MLSGLDKNLKLGDKIQVTLEFNNSGPVTLEPILKIKPPVYNQ